MMAVLQAVVCATFILVVSINILNGLPTEAKPKYLSVFLTNKHGRSVRVISKAPSNATVNQTVKPGASVSIKVKFQTGNMEQVELTAVDENTGIRVALNQNKSIVVNTTFNQNVVTKVTASPLGFNILPEYSFNFVQDNVNYVYGYPKLKKITGHQLKFSQKYNGLKFFGANYVEGSLPAENFCLVTPESCSKGITIGFKIRIPSQRGYFVYKQYIIDTPAVTVYFYNAEMVISLRTSSPSKEWEVNTKTLQFNKWMYVVFTWQQEIGAELYINSIKLSEDPKGKTTNLSTQSSVTPKKKIIKKYQHLLIGTSLKGGLEGTVKFFYFASLTILYQHVDKDMADEMMVFFWNNDLAQMYWALLYIYNSENTSVILESKGDSVISLRPNAQVSTIIRSLTLDGLRPDPFQFRAKKENGSYTKISRKDIFVVQSEKYVAKKYQLIIGNFIG